MSYPVVFSTKAAEEVFEQALYLNEHREGYGQLFNQAVRMSAQMISRNPNRFPSTIERPNIQKVPLAKPFQRTHTLYYRFDGEKIRIICVFPNRRDPKIWRERES